MRSPGKHFQSQFQEQLGWPSCQNGPTFKYSAAARLSGFLAHGRKAIESIIDVLGPHDVPHTASPYATAATLLLLDLNCLQFVRDYQQQKQNSDRHSHHTKVEFKTWICWGTGRTGGNASLCSTSD